MSQRMEVEVKRQRIEVKVRPRREEISRMMEFEVRVKFKEVESKKAPPPTHVAGSDDPMVNFLVVTVEPCRLPRPGVGVVPVTKVPWQASSMTGLVCLSVCSLF